MALCRNRLSISTFPSVLSYPQATEVENLLRCGFLGSHLSCPLNHAFRSADLVRIAARSSLGLYTAQSVRAAMSYSSLMCLDLLLRQTDVPNLLDCYSLLKGEQSFSYLRDRAGSHSPICRAQAGSASPVSDAEKEAWDKRQEEAGDNGKSISSWQWTLNWNDITPNIVVGSCPRSAEDVDQIVEKANVGAILNLQSSLCFEALKIPIDSICRRAAERGVYLARVSIRDFDHGDQALMLPEAVRTLNMLLARGLRVYVHCTAGINRATLTVVGYLTFVQGMNLDDAVKLVKSARSVAHPYIDCWVEVKRRLLEGRIPELTGTSRHIYEARRDKGISGNSRSDWEAAQRQVIMNTFARWLEIDLGILQTELDLLDRQYAAALRKVKIEFEKEFTDAKRLPINIVQDPANAMPTQNDDDYELSASELECDVITRQCVLSENDELDGGYSVDNSEISFQSSGNGSPTSSSEADAAKITL